MISLTTKWRKYVIAFTADIEKIYRQIYFDESQTDLQCRFWRNSPKEKLQEYKLLTITYRTTNAPYLAIRTLNQLAEDEAENHSLAESRGSRAFGEWKRLVKCYPLFLYM